MNIGELLKSVCSEDVLSIIKLHYGNKYLTEYRNLINKLKDISCENHCETSIFIKVYRENDCGEEIIENFDELDSRVFFDVCAKKCDDDTIYSIASSSYKEFVEFEVEQKTLDKISPESILAHCIYEVTAYSFDDND